MRRVLSMALLPIILIGIVTAFCLQSVIQGNLLPHSHAQGRDATGTTYSLPPRQVSLSGGQVSYANQLNSANPYVYYTLKQSDGFVLARAPKGTDGQPLATPQPVAHFGDGFGLVESDNVLSMQLSPDGHFLAIDGTRDHGEQVWIYNTQQGTISLTPPDVMGNFLHWLPHGTGHMFLYRPMFPLGPSAPMDRDGWNPGLWEVDAATGKHINIALGVPSAFIIDATSSPDGTRIIYSTTTGLGMGSDTWWMNSDGSGRTHLFHSGNGAQAIAGFFTWSPDGTTLAYELLSDSPRPFLPAGLWVMDGHGRQQHRLADVDGGHGYAPAWSPDGRKIAFIMRTNVSDHRADTNAQSLQSAIAVVDVTTRQSWVVALSAQTGVPVNVNPVWASDGNSITFTAFNPLNRLLGGMPRYWSARVVGAGEQPNVIPLAPPLTHVVAVG